MIADYKVLPWTANNNQIDRVLVQLMWADYLPGVVIDRVLEIYQEKVSDKLFLIRVQADRKSNAPIRTERGKVLWDRIYKNWIDNIRLR